MARKNINFIFNFHAPVGQNISHVEHMDVHFDKDMNMQVVDTMGGMDGEGEQVDSGSKDSAAGELVKTRNPKHLLFKSEQEQAHWSKVFLDFLKEHNRVSEQLTTSADAFVNRALACFHKQWEKRGLLNDRAYGKAPSLFLFEDCAIKGAADKTHSNKIKTILAEAYKYEQANLKSNMMIEVEEIVNKNI